MTQTNRYLFLILCITSFATESCQHECPDTTSQILKEIKPDHYPIVNQRVSIRKNKVILSAEIPANKDHKISDKSVRMIASSASHIIYNQIQNASDGCSVNSVDVILDYQNEQYLMAYSEKHLSAMTKAKSSSDKFIAAIRERDTMVMKTLLNHHYFDTHKISSLLDFINSKLPSMHNVDEFSFCCFEVLEDDSYELFYKNDSNFISFIIKDSLTVKDLIQGIEISKN